jgi:hypothetical protein
LTNSHRKLTEEKEVSEEDSMSEKAEEAAMSELKD